MSLGPDLLRTALTAAVGSGVGAIVGGTVSVLWRRWMHRRRARLEALLRDVEQLGHTAAVQILNPKGPRMIDLAHYQKGIAAGAGVILTGLLTWAETVDLEPVLGPLVPDPFRPLVGVVLGGVALTASVILAPNKPKRPPLTTIDEQPDEEAAEPLPVAAIPTPAAARLATVTTGPFWSGVTAGAAAGAATSAVELLDLPDVGAYQ